MEQNIINNLPNILQHTTTLRCLSFDKNNGQYMTYNQKTAIDFDEIKNFHNIENSNAFELKSNDTLYIAKNDIHYFIEFKNGSYKNLNKFNLISKICDSVYII